MKILFLQKRILFTTDNGGKISTINVIQYMTQWHAVNNPCNLQPRPGART